MPDISNKLGYVQNNAVVRIGINVMDWHTDVLAALGTDFAGLSCVIVNPETGATTSCPPAPGQPTLPQGDDAVAVSSPTQRCEFLWRAARGGAGPALPFEFRFSVVDSGGQSQMGMNVLNTALMVGSGGLPPSGWEWAPGADPS